MRAKIESAAIPIIEKYGLANLKAATICKKLKIPPGSFSYHMKCTFYEFVEELRKKGLTGDAKKINGGRASSAALRRDFIINKATILARRKGLKKLTRARIAAAAGVSVVLLSTYFTMPRLKNEIVARAIVERDMLILAHAVNEGSYRMPRRLRAEVVKHISGK